MCFRNESKIVLVFETFFNFFYQKNARNKHCLGWHSWAALQKLLSPPLTVMGFLI